MREISKRRVLAIVALRLQILFGKRAIKDFVMTISNEEHDIK